MKTDGTFVCSPKNQSDKLSEEHATNECAQISVTAYVIRNYTNYCSPTKRKKMVTYFGVIFFKTRRKTCCQRCASNKATFHPSGHLMQ
jgi:hypothetical protein